MKLVLMKQNSASSFLVLLPHFVLSCFTATYILVRDFNLWLEATVQPHQRNMKYEREYDVKWPS
jgi:hypothetical protein